MILCTFRARVCVGGDAMPLYPFSYILMLLMNACLSYFLVVVV